MLCSFTFVIFMVGFVFRVATTIPKKIFCTVIVVLLLSDDSPQMMLAVLIIQLYWLFKNWGSELNNEGEKKYYFVFSVIAIVMLVFVAYCGGAVNPGPFYYSFSG